VKKWRLIVGPSLAGPLNMAIDETLASGAAADASVPTLRLYSFNPPCITVGRFQPLAGLFDAGACARAGIDVTRRPTGGLAILHKDDFTYALTCPIHEGDIASREEHFRGIARGVVASLEQVGIEGRVVSHGGAKLSPGWCFDREFGVDIEWNARKICGSAQRLYQASMLQHGSLFLEDSASIVAELSTGAGAPAGRVPVSLAEACGRKVGWEEMARAFSVGFARALEIQLEPGEMSAREWEEATRMAREKYSDPCWIAGDSGKSVCDIIVPDSSAGDFHG
jgi:lipoyl(octanoyl) transferase